ncbi:hypothetical protein BDV32DRAFT_148383 [Aspergillus pseudonomiae]|nr:hypothetical protein BDV32DRAFT_148383 [Aspergillus pseudonomiae]
MLGLKTLACLCLVGIAQAQLPWIPIPLPIPNPGTGSGSGSGSGSGQPSCPACPPPPACPAPPACPPAAAPAIDPTIVSQAKAACAQKRPGTVPVFQSPCLPEGLDFHPIGTSQHVAEQCFWGFLEERRSQ